MRALVTGANGLLGCNLVRELINSGHEVRAMVRRTSKMQGLEGLACTLVYGDVRDAAEVLEAAKDCEVIFHCAAVFAYWGYSRDVMMDTAKKGSVNVLDAAKAVGARRVVMTSSTAVFGGSDGPKVLDERAPTVGAGVPDYFVSKAEQEQAAREHAATIGVEVVFANPSVFIGPHDHRPSASLNTVTGYLTDPMKLTYPGGANVMHATDVARGHLLLAEKGMPGERYILAAENVTWRDMHEMLAELAGVSRPRFTVTRGPAVLAASIMELGAKVTKREPLATVDLARQTGRYFWYSNAKAARLGFSPRSMRLTLTQTLAWLLAASPHFTDKQRAKMSPHEDVLQAMREARISERVRRDQPA
ncbi:MAG: NAD-dependent epimerase/dehydratase family protein [Myxococcota bacterium]